MGLLNKIGLTKKNSEGSVADYTTDNNKAKAKARAKAARDASAPKNTPTPTKNQKKTATSAQQKPNKKGTKPASPRERIQSAAAPLHDRRRRLVSARETVLRDLGGLMLEMYKRNRFREELLLDKCEEILGVEVEIAHVDQRLFQLAPPNAAGMRPIGRCDCGAPIHPGQNFCGVCGRSFSTLTHSKNCTKCGNGLRPGDQFCATCGTEAPDVLQALEAGSNTHDASITETTTQATPSAIAASAVAETLIIEAPPIEDTEIIATDSTPETVPNPVDDTSEQPSQDPILDVTPPPTPSVSIAPSAPPIPEIPEIPETPEEITPPPVINEETSSGFDWAASPTSTPEQEETSFPTALPNHQVPQPAQPKAIKEKKKTDNKKVDKEALKLEKAELAAKKKAAKEAANAEKKAAKEAAIAQKRVAQEAAAAEKKAKKEAAIAEKAKQKLEKAQAKEKASAARKQDKK